MKPQELRQETAERLLEMLKEKRQAIIYWRLKAATSSGISPHEYRQNRKDIARILTILAERGIRLQQPAPAGAAKE